MRTHHVPPFSHLAGTFGAQQAGSSAITYTRGRHPKWQHPAQSCSTEQAHKRTNAQQRARQPLLGSVCWHSPAGPRSRRERAARACRAPQRCRGTELPLGAADAAGGGGKSAPVAGEVAESGVDEFGDVQRALRGCRRRRRRRRRGPEERAGRAAPLFSLLRASGAMRDENGTENIGQMLEAGKGGWQV